MPKKLNKLLIFTKSPVLGEVKTRLQPDFTPEQSLIIHEKLILNTLDITKKLNNIDVELCCSPNRNTLFFLNCEKKYPISLSNQEGSNLGERMAFSLSVALQTYENVIVIGTDCPELSENYLLEAFEALDDKDAVIGPAADGGYVLLGLKNFDMAIFTDISWSSDKVLIQTKNALKKLSWSYKELSIMDDLDRPDDLRRHKKLLELVS